MSGKRKHKEISESLPNPDKDLQKLLRDSQERGSEERGIRDDKAVKEIIERNKSAAKAKYAFPEYDFFVSRQYSPLYIAIRESASFDVVKMLYRAYPEAARERAHEDGTLLHCAVMYHESPRLAKLLLEAWPAAVEVKDDSGVTPLHAACSYNASVEIVSLLLEQWPEAAKVKDSYGYTPLHAACREYASVEIVSLLLEQWPAAVEVEDSNGWTPKARHGKQKTMLSGIRRLLKSIDQQAATEIMTDFVAIEWWAGVRIFFDLYTDSVKTLEDIPLSAIPSMISRLGCCCKLLTMWNIMQNRQDILKIS